MQLQITISGGCLVDVSLFTENQHVVLKEGTDYILVDHDNDMPADYVGTLSLSRLKDGVIPAFLEQQRDEGESSPDKSLFIEWLRASCHLDQYRIELLNRYEIDPTLDIYP